MPSSRPQPLIVTLLVVLVTGCGGEEPESRDVSADIYAAASYHLAAESNTSGSEHRFTELLVVDGPTSGAGTGLGVGSGHGMRPFTAAERAAIESALLQLSPVRFVKRGQDWRTEDLRPRVPGAAILTLGTINFTGEERTEVGVGLWCGGLCAFWATFVVERDGSDWVVTGTTGEVGMS